MDGLVGLKVVHTWDREKSGGYKGMGWESGNKEKGWQRGVTMSTSNDIYFLFVRFLFLPPPVG